jgi:hypothetical protein
LSIAASADRIALTAMRSWSRIAVPKAVRIVVRNDAESLALTSAT